MGGSSSKKKEESNKIKVPLKDEQNETFYKEQKQKDIHINDKNLIKIDDISNDIEELTLDKNGLLINEKDIIKPRVEPHSEKKLTKKMSKISLNNYNNIIKEKEEKIILYTEKESNNIITSFYDDIIEIILCFNSRKTFIALVKSINRKYLYNFNSKKFPNTRESQDFLESFKYSSIIIVCFIFLVKDLNLYESSGKKIKENLEQFVFTCLDSLDRTVIFSLKIITFIQKYRKIKKSYFGCTNSIIKILFKNKESYKHILNCLEQILSNINTDSVQDIITKINESILFCYNATNIINENISIKNKNEKINTTKINNKSKLSKKIRNESRNNRKQIINNKITYKNEKNTQNTNNKEIININKDNNNTNINTKNNIIGSSQDNSNNDERNNSEANNAPFIKKELDKKFCLVLDIDETLSHMIKLPFGNYFLVRPGVLDLLKELYSYYEIDIFTAALKHYADNIINKLDKDNIYISYRLYRCHCTYEDGKSVKKLSLIGRDLNKIVFVDDLKRNAKYNMKNLALVSKWIDNVYDKEIINLKNKLKFIALCGKYDEDITKGLVDEKLSEDVNQ